MGQPGGERRTGQPRDRADRLSREPGSVPAARPATGAAPRGIARARAFVRTLPVLFVAAGVIYDYLTPSEFTATPLFAAAPLVAAPLYSLRGTVLAGVLAVAAVLATHFVLGIVLQVDAVTEVVTVAMASVLAVLINTVVRRGDERLASVREIAEFAQRAVLPEPEERIAGLEVAARYEAAQEDAFIGGDLYAVQDSPHGVRLVVGDVRGKGMTAVATVATVVGAFREAAEREATLEGVAERLERALTRAGTRRDSVDAAEGFTTAVLAEIPHGENVVRVVNRGHPPPLLLRPDGTLLTLSAESFALPLGMSELGGLPAPTVREGFPRGTTLLLHTDGLSEARDARGEFFDPAAWLAGRVFPGPDALLAALYEAALRHTGGALTDDLALLAVRHP
ncbi:PP2C family protein-serine/threonine phosphatase [Streptomyces sp. NPDC048404]|uniref:PP2C family protein-serine/threonine phosphatase n=1 Tax=unclassified Streptomyces TaxID=2593676 RepID=UPI003427EC06